MMKKILISILCCMVLAAVAMTGQTSAHSLALAKGCKHLVLHPQHVYELFPDFASSQIALADFTLEGQCLTPRSAYTITSTLLDGQACMATAVGGSGVTQGPPVTIRTDVLGRFFATFDVEDCLPQKYDITVTHQLVGSQFHVTVKISA